MNYFDKLKDPRWQRKRLEIFQRDDWKCTKCSSATKELHVHHTEYINGLAPHEHPDNLMVTLCCLCHRKEHKLIPDEQHERKRLHEFIRHDDPDIIKSIQRQILQLQDKLKEPVDDDLMDQVLKNIIYLQTKRK